jgi:DNA-3-methyladenine glycosylase I
MPNLTRCTWCLKDEQEKHYHDTEWGMPVHDDGKHFEFIVLDTFQAGLSWRTVLHKRENFSKAFNQFNYKKIAQYGEEKVQHLLLDKGIIRNQLKIRATITNAQAFIKIQKEFGSYDKYVWQFVEEKTIMNHRITHQDVPATSSQSDVLSKDLYKRGFKFVGSTIVYAYMQAAGLVNDHLVTCWRYDKV